MVSTSADAAAPLTVRLGSPFVMDRATALFASEAESVAWVIGRLCERKSAEQFLSLAASILRMCSSVIPRAFSSAVSGSLAAAGVLTRHLSAVAGHAVNAAMPKLCSDYERVLARVFSQNGTTAAVLAMNVVLRVAERQDTRVDTALVHAAVLELLRLPLSRNGLPLRLATGAHGSFEEVPSAVVNGEVVRALDGDWEGGLAFAHHWACLARRCHATLVAPPVEQALVDAERALAETVPSSPAPPEESYDWALAEYAPVPTYCGVELASVLDDAGI